MDKGEKLKAMSANLDCSFALTLDAESANGSPTVDGAGELYQ